MRLRQYMCRSQSPSRSARTNRWAKKVGIMKQSTHIRPVGVLRATSSYSSMFATSVVPANMYCCSKAVVTMRKPRIALGHAFPFNMLLIPLNAAPKISSRPLPFIKWPMAPRKDIKVCIPPGCNTIVCHLSGSHHRIWLATLKSCMSAVRIQYGDLCWCMTCWQYVIVVSTVSGCAGGLSINGPNTYWVGWPIELSSLASAFMWPDHSQASSPEKSDLWSPTSHSKSNCMALFRLVCCFMRSSNCCPRWIITFGGFGFLMPTWCKYSTGEISLNFNDATCTLVNLGITGNFIFLSWTIVGNVCWINSIAIACVSRLPFGVYTFKSVIKPGTNQPSVRR